MGRSPANTRRWSAYGLRAVLTLAILAAMVALVADRSLLEALQALSLAAFGAALLLHIAGSIVVPAMISKLASGGTPLDLRLSRFILINFGIRFYTMILPRASATGVRWLKYRAGSGGSDAAALVMIEKLVQIFVYCLLATAFLGFEAPSIGAAVVPLFAVTGGLLVASGVGLLAVFTTRLDPVLSRFSAVRRWQRIRGPVEQLAEAIEIQRGRPRRQLVVLGLWSALGFAFFVASAWVVAEALSVEVPLTGLAWIRGVVFIGTLIPITIAGAGVREAGFVGFLSMYGVPNATALGLALSLLGVQVAIGAIGGLVELRGLLTKWVAKPIPAPTTAQDRPVHG